MQINQAFEILARAGNAHDARVITENTKKFSRLAVWRMARALRRGVPVAKIIHQKWFYGLKFYTNRHTLDPRPDTETLVAAVISDCGGKHPNILDVGTGTGCIIASLVKNIPGARGVGIDVSHGALRVARRNVRQLNLTDKIHIVRKSFNNPNAFEKNTFDVIVSNPPYIAAGDARVDAGAQHDPKRALYANDNGYAAYKSIAKNSRKWIRRGGKIYLEIGIDMAVRVREIFEEYGWHFDRTEKDLSGIERVIVFSV